MEEETPALVTRQPNIAVLADTIGPNGATGNTSLALATTDIVRHESMANDAMWCARMGTTDSSTEVLALFNATTELGLQVVQLV